MFEIKHRVLPTVARSQDSVFTGSAPCDLDRHRGHDQKQSYSKIRKVVGADRPSQAEEIFMEDGVQLLELARNASQLFARQTPHEKKRLLNLLLSNCDWYRGETKANFRQLLIF
ncbi:hypothetical protein [Roseibium sp.]|uniref:hypothetical protein n=1 Tax=Roseibium sp. TaxID=1936156 RepID=UPI003A9834CE